MTNLWFNVRFGSYFWQWGPDGMTWQRNQIHDQWRANDPISWKWFAAYRLFGKDVE